MSLKGKWFRHPLVFDSLAPRDYTCRMSQETDARILIDRLLREAGWNIADKAQVSTEEATRDGRADYVLKDSRSRPLAVIEAKRFSIDPYSAKDQARAYAQSLPIHFVILSNGQDHYFWDYADGDARPIWGWTRLRGRLRLSQTDGMGRGVWGCAARV